MIFIIYAGHLTAGSEFTGVFYSKLIPQPQMSHLVSNQVQHISGEIIH